MCNWLVEAQIPSLTVSKSLSKTLKPAKCFRSKHLLKTQCKKLNGKSCIFGKYILCYQDNNQLSVSGHMFNCSLNTSEGFTTTRGRGFWTTVEADKHNNDVFIFWVSSLKNAESKGKKKNVLQRK